MNLGSLPQLGQPPTRNPSGSWTESWTEQERLCLPVVPMTQSQERQAPGMGPGSGCQPAPWSPGLQKQASGHTHNQAPLHTSPAGEELEGREAATVGPAWGCEQLT